MYYTKVFRKKKKISCLSHNCSVVCPSVSVSVYKLIVQAPLGLQLDGVVSQIFQYYYGAASIAIVSRDTVQHFNTFLVLKPGVGIDI